MTHITRKDNRRLKPLSRIPLRSKDTEFPATKDEIILEYRRAMARLYKYKLLTTT